MSEESSENRNDQEVADAWAAALEEQAAVEGGDDGGAGDAGDAAGAAGGEGADGGAAGEDFEVAGMSPVEPEGQPLEGDANLEVILDIPVTVSMEIGRTSISIRNLLQLNQGSVVELDRLAGEPMDVLVNGTLIAHGEVVVVNEKFGIRLTDVISPAERVRKLR